MMKTKDRYDVIRDLLNLYNGLNDFWERYADINHRPLRDWEVASREKVKQLKAAIELIADDHDILADGTFRH